MAHQNAAQFTQCPSLCSLTIVLYKFVERGAGSRLKSSRVWTPDDSRFHLSLSRERERERREGRENIKSICPFWFREMAMPQHPRLLEIHFKTLELTFIISRFPDI